MLGARRAEPSKAAVSRQLGVLGPMWQGEAGGFKCHRPNGSSVGSRVERWDLEDNFAMPRYGQENGAGLGPGHYLTCE